MSNDNNKKMCECTRCTWIGNESILSVEGLCPLCMSEVWVDEYTYGVNYSMSVVPLEKPWRLGDMLLTNIDESQAAQDYNFTLEEIEGAAYSSCALADLIILKMIGGR